MRARRTEHEVLSRIGVGELGPAQRAIMRRLLSEVEDWDYLFAVAIYHGLVPLLHQHVQLAAADLVPASFLSRLKQFSIANAQNVLHLLSKQLKLSRVFKDNNVPLAIQ